MRAYGGRRPCQHKPHLARQYRQCHADKGLVTERPGDASDRIVPVFLSRRGWIQVEHDDVDARRAYLYAPERIVERFRTFEAITLPGLRAQTDPDFSFLILVDEALPTSCRTAACAGRGSAAGGHPAPRAGPHRRVCQTVLTAARRDIAAPASSSGWMTTTPSPAISSPAAAPMPRCCATSARATSW